jgi:hypothetical protein
MFTKNQSRDISITLGSILALLFTLFCGSGINVSASVATAPNYLLGNLSLNTNLTAPQILDFTDKITNYTNQFIQESNGNLTKMNILLIDDLQKRNIINENDKQELLSLNTALGEIEPTNNITLINSDVSSLLEETVTNSSNPMIITLKSDLNKKIRDIGTNIGGLGGIPGLPPLTIGSFWDDEHRSMRLTLGCQAAGSAAMGFTIGAYIGSICGVILV